ncbi:MAG: leucine-rich repeat domain-containing protein, partial [Lachnospiraceae bacterium]|nr:leucine-rich repeat domain-containing protein [Lachnospiraceae bacterium]
MRKHEWKKMHSAVVAASMVFSLAPVNVGVASAQSEQTTTTEAKEAAQSIEDVLDQGIKDTMNLFGVDAWYFPDAIDGVVDAGTIYLKGKGSSSWTRGNSGRSWESSNPDKPIKTLIVKDASISDNSFSSMKELTKVKLEGIVTLGNSVFNSCPNLEQVDLGEDLTDLGTYTFGNDISLTHIRIPAGVTKLKVSVFYNCTSLRDLAICTTEAQPDMGSTNAMTFARSQSLIYCSSGRGGMEHPFGGCSDLTIYVAERGNGIETAMDFTYKDCVGGAYSGTQDLTSVTYSFSTLDQYEAKQEATGELTVSCPDVYTGKVPEPKIVKNETGIANTAVKWMYFDKNKTAISEDTVTAKMGQRYVKAVLRDDTHFAYMSDYVPFQVQAPLTYTIEDGVLKIAPIAGVDKMAMPDFDQPDYSGSEAFAPWKDEEYTSIEIADGITSIGGWAFAKASGLKKVVLGENVTSIGSYAFYGSSLEEIDLSASGVISIEDNAFSNCEQLASVKLPEKLETIGNSAFRECGQLASVKLPEKLKTIGTYAFYNCSSLKLVEGLENTKLTEIANDLFCNCSSLSNIQIPATVNKVGNYAFQGCTRLINVIYQTGAEGTVNLGSLAFSGCTSLENVLLSGKNLTIGARAFSGCSTLKKITIKEVTGENGSTLDIYFNAFENVTATIYVPNATVQAAVRDNTDAYENDANKDIAEQKVKVITTGDDSDIAVKKFSSLSITLEEDAKEPGQVFAPSVVEKVG